MHAAAVIGKHRQRLDAHQQQQPLVAPGVHTNGDPDHDATSDNADNPARHGTHDPSQHAQRPTQRLRLDRSLDLGFELRARAPGRL
jgi:hypothetical protein